MRAKNETNWLLKEILRLRSNINVGQVKRSSLWRWREKAKINSANFQMLMKNCGWKSRGFRFLSRVGLKVEICLKVFQWDYRKNCRLAAAESLAISSNVVCSSLVKSWKTKSPLHTHHCNLSLPPFTCDCCNYVNSSLILVIVNGITSFGHKTYFPFSHTRFLQYFSLDIVHYRHHLDTDAFHHVQLPSAVQVQNGLKLAGGPAVWA